MRFTFNKSLLVASVLLAISSQSAFATNGMSAHGFGTTQKAMGGAAVAGSDNAMNAATNPASMSFGEDNWTVGMEIFQPDRNASDSAGTAFNGNQTKSFVVPEAAYQRKLNDKHSVGVAVYGNGGMNVDYDKAIFSMVNKKAKQDLSQLFIAPSWSMKLNDKHSVGASLNIGYQRLNVEGVDAFAGISSSAGNLTDRGYDSSTGVGATVGWQGQVLPDVKMGAAYRTRTYMSKFDKYKGLLAEQGDLDVPAQVTVGVSIQATPKTTVAADVQHIYYSDVKSIGNKNNTATGVQLGTDNGAGYGWDDQTTLKIGVKHQLKQNVALMAGYNHGNSPISESETAFNILAPATVEDHVTLGAEWSNTKKSKWTAYYMHAFENEIKGDGSAGSRTNGGATVADIKMKQNAVGIAYSVKF